MSLLRRCFVLLCSALVLSSASLPCPGAALITFSLKGLMWLNGTPLIDAATNSRRVLSSDISATELSQLSGHDIVLLIDRSYSMAKKDCLPLSFAPQADSPILDDQSRTPISRWQWCHQQTLDLAKRTQGMMPAGVSVVLFSDQYVVFNSVDAKAIETVFTDYVPKGGTNTTTALKSQLDRYFERRGQLGQGSKPLLIAVITDGCPGDPSKLRYAIIDATRQMKAPDEIIITFLQIGSDSNGRKLLKELDDGLVDRKAQFDIVNVVPFSEMRKIGLARALVDAIAKR